MFCIPKPYLQSTESVSSFTTVSAVNTFLSDLSPRSAFFNGEERIGRAYLFGLVVGCHLTPSKLSSELCCSKDLSYNFVDWTWVFDIWPVSVGSGVKDSSTFSVLESLMLGFVDSGPFLRSSSRSLSFGACILLFLSSMELCGLYANVFCGRKYDVFLCLSDSFGLLLAETGDFPEFLSRFSIIANHESTNI